MNTQTTDTSEGSLPQTISDAAWKSVLPFLKAFPNVYVGNPETCRRFLSAVVWITKEGASWRALPNVYGYWNTIYRRYSRWCDAGVFEALYEHFHQAGELSAILVDSTIVRAHSCAAEAPKKRRTREGSSRTQPWRIHHKTSSVAERHLGPAAMDIDIREPQRYNASLGIDQGLFAEICHRG